MRFIHCLHDPLIERSLWLLQVNVDYFLVWIVSVPVSSFGIVHILIYGIFSPPLPFESSLLQLVYNIVVLCNFTVSENSKLVVTVRTFI